MERAEAIDNEPDFVRTIDPRRNAAASRRRHIWALIVMVVVVIAAALAWRARHPSEPAAIESPPAVATPEPPATTAPQHPIGAAGLATPAGSAPLPALSDSDAPLRDAMSGLFGAVPLERVFHLQDIARRFVATIDNLPRATAALQRMPVKPVDGALEITQTDGKTVIRTDNALRYAPYVRLMEAADTHRLVATYAQFYPLFQQAYEELGYPGRYFNDRLVEVIDHLLAAPEIAGPIALVQPKVVYRFADPDVEALSAGQKVMLRMGTANEARVKAKLRDIRAALTGQALPR